MIILIFMSLDKKEILQVILRNDYLRQRIMDMSY